MSRYPSQRYSVGAAPEGGCYPWESGTSHSGDEAALFEEKKKNESQQIKDSLSSMRTQFKEICV